MNNPPVFGVLQVSRGVSCLLFIIGLLCTGRQARPSLTTLCKWVRERKIKPVQREPLGAGVLLARLASFLFRCYLKIATCLTWKRLHIAGAVRGMCRRETSWRQVCCFFISGHTGGTLPLPSSERFSFQKSVYIICFPVEKNHCKNSKGFICISLNLGGVVLVFCFCLTEKKERKDLLQLHGKI